MREGRDATTAKAKEERQAQKVGNCSQRKSKLELRLAAASSTGLMRETSLWSIVRFLPLKFTIISVELTLTTSTSSPVIFNLTYVPNQWKLVSIPERLIF